MTTKLPYTGNVKRKFEASTRGTGTNKHAPGLRRKDEEFRESARPDFGVDLKRGVDAPTAVDRTAQPAAFDDDHATPLTAAALPQVDFREPWITRAPEFYKLTPEASEAAGIADLCAILDDESDPCHPLNLPALDDEAPPVPSAVATKAVKPPSKQTRMRELLMMGVSSDEIMRITGCRAQHVSEGKRLARIAWERGEYPEHEFMPANIAASKRGPPKWNAMKTKPGSE